MEREILYMLGVVAVGFAVNYSLRALPFLLFAGKGRALPPWVERLGNFLSPVIIAGLIVYSYSGLEWKTAWPYLAGALTVGLQLWKRNALASILAGTVLYMILVNVGCASRPDLEVSVDAKNPSVAVRKDGFYVGETKVGANDVVEILKDADIPTTQTIHIFLDEDVKNLTPARTLMGTLAKAGYSQPVLVTQQHGFSKSKSGKTYSDEELARREEVLVRHADAAYFTVTPEGVRYGLLRPVGTNEVVAILRENKVKREQQIKIFAREEHYVAKDDVSQAVRSHILRLEAILRDAGYRKIGRYTLEALQDEMSPGQATVPPPSRPKVRYRKTNE